MGRTVIVGATVTHVPGVDRTGVAWISWHDAGRRRRAFNGNILSFLNIYIIFLFSPENTNKEGVGGRNRR